METFEDGVPERTYEIFRDIANPDFSILRGTVDPFLETLAMAVVGTLVGCSLALAVAFGASPVTAGGRWRLNVTKTVMSVVPEVSIVRESVVLIARFATRRR